MKHVIAHGPESAREILTRERCYIRERLNDPRVPELSVADCRVLPGVTTELHRLSVDEWYVVSGGCGLVEVGDQDPVTVGPGDAVAIPRGTSQRITAKGPGELLFQCVCMPRFTPDCYEALE